MLLLGFLAALLAAVPFGGYYVCALVTVPDHGYAAGWLLFFAGFIAFAGIANRLKYRQGLERLEAEDHTSASGPGGADQYKLCPHCRVAGRTTHVRSSA
jgi:hypothetical protein